MTDRLNIEVDYCPQCRGVWLDRGELDKIIERSMREPAQIAAMPAPQQNVSSHGYRGNHHDKHHGYRGKKSIWKELFD